MAKDTCEATITKRLVWLVEPLVVSSYGFSFLFHFVLEIYQKPQIPFFSMFPTFLCFTVLFSFYSLFSFLFILSDIEELLTYT